MNEVLIGRDVLDEMRCIVRRLLSRYRPDGNRYELDVERLLALLNKAARPKLIGTTASEGNQVNQVNQVQVGCSTLSDVTPPSA